jgi:trans-aconitate methyltransferase
MSLGAEYFDALYASDGDPWGFATRWYEARKYALTLAALPNARYHRAFEPGCSIGVLTALLADRCDHLVASDPSAAALSEAASRIPDHVELVHGAVPEIWPPGTFDLVVCSEVGYYLSASDLEQCTTRVAACLEPHGHLVAVHWRPKVTGYPGDGALVHHAFADTFLRLAHYEDDFVLLDVFGGPSATLVAPD